MILQIAYPSHFDCIYSIQSIHYIDRYIKMYAYTILDSIYMSIVQLVSKVQSIYDVIIFIKTKKSIL